MVGSGDDRFHEVTALCAAALRSAQSALAGVIPVLVGDASKDGTVQLKASEAALHDLHDVIDVLQPEDLPASDLRSALAAVHVGGDMLRVAELTRQIAETAWSWGTRERAVPSVVRAAVNAVGDGAVALVAQTEKTARLSSSKPSAGGAQDGATVSDLDRRFAAVSRSQRALDEVLVDEAGHIDVSLVVDAALLGRCYEGCAWHAMAAVRHLTPQKR
jgi:hypothetical protein